jgi:hypothetical protein
MDAKRERVERVKHLIALASISVIEMGLVSDDRVDACRRDAVDSLLTAIEELRKV